MESYAKYIHAHQPTITNSRFLRTLGKACPTSDFAKRSFCLVAKPAMSLRNRKAIRPIKTSAKLHSLERRRNCNCEEHNRPETQFRFCSFSSQHMLLPWASHSWAHGLPVTNMGMLALHYRKGKWYNRQVATHQKARHSLESNDLPN